MPDPAEQSGGQSPHRGIGVLPVGPLCPKLVVSPLDENLASVAPFPGLVGRIHRRAYCRELCRVWAAMLTVDLDLPLALVRHDVLHHLSHSGASWLMPPIHLQSSRLWE